MTDVVSPGQGKGCGPTCPYRRAVFALLVWAQFVLVIALLWIQPSPRVGYLIGTLWGGAILLGVWSIATMGRKNLNASPALRQGASLVQRGPYRVVRHPMYAALLLFTLAYVLADVNRLAAQIWIGLVVVLALKARYEEEILLDTFAEYAEYRRRTWRLIPYVL